MTERLRLGRPHRREIAVRRGPKHEDPTFLSLWVTLYKGYDKRPMHPIQSENSPSWVLDRVTRISADHRNDRVLICCVHSTLGFLGITIELIMGENRKKPRRTRKRTHLPSSFMFLAFQLPYCFVSLSPASFFMPLHKPHRSLG